jgi:hypothetical protein
MLLVDWKILQQNKEQPNRGATKEKPSILVTAITDKDQKQDPSLNPKLKQSPNRGGGERW